VLGKVGKVFYCAKFKEFKIPTPIFQFSKRSKKVRLEKDLFTTFDEV
jgi:hypothetical protein